MPGRQQLKQEDLLQKSYVIANGRPAQLERACEVAHVDGPRRLPRREGKEAWESVQRAGAPQVSHIAPDVGFDVVALPRSPFAARQLGPGPRDNHPP